MTTKSIIHYSLKMQITAGTQFKCLNKISSLVYNWSFTQLATLDSIIQLLLFTIQTDKNTASLQV